MKFKEKLIKKLNEKSVDGFIKRKIYNSKSYNMIYDTYSNVGHYFSILPNLDELEDKLKPEIAIRVLEEYNELPLTMVYSEKILCSAIWLEAYQETFNVILPDYQSPFVN